MYCIKCKNNLVGCLAHVHKDYLECIECNIYDRSFPIEEVEEVKVEKPSVMKASSWMKKLSPKTIRKSKN